MQLHGRDPDQHLWPPRQLRARGQPRHPWPHPQVPARQECVLLPPDRCDARLADQHCVAENGTPFVVSGTGKPLRQFIYSRDLAKLFIWQLREYDEIAPIILSGASPRRSRAYYRSVSSSINVAQSARKTRSRSSRSRTPSSRPSGSQVTTRCVRPPPDRRSGQTDPTVTQFDSTKADGQFKKTASNAKLRKYLPDFQFTPFEEGESPPSVQASLSRADWMHAALDDSVKWFVNNYDSARTGH